MQFMSAKSRKWFLIISILAIIGILILLSFYVFETIVLQVPWGFPIVLKNPWQFSRHPGMIPYIILWPFSILLVLAIVPISYYFISRKLEKNLEIILKLINKDVASEIKPIKMDNREILFKFLNQNERKVLEKLIEGKGTALQSEISLMEGMNKLKTHRAVKSLEKKGIIKIESYGKTNRIILSKDIKDILC